MVYIVLSVVLVGIALCCLRQKVDAGIIPLCCLAFLLSSLLSSFYYTYDFFRNKESHVITIDTTEIKGEMTTHRGMGFFKPYIEIKDSQFILEGGSPFDTQIVCLDTVTFLRRIEVKKNYDNGLILPIIFTVEKTEELHLTEKDYEIYNAFLSSLEERD